MGEGVGVGVASAADSDVAEPDVAGSGVPAVPDDEGCGVDVALASATGWVDGAGSNHRASATPPPSTTSAAATSSSGNAGEGGFTLPVWHVDDGDARRSPVSVQSPTNTLVGAGEARR